MTMTLALPRKAPRQVPVPADAVTIEDLLKGHVDVRIDAQGGVVVHGVPTNVRIDNQPVLGAGLQEPIQFAPGTRVDFLPQAIGG